MSPSSERGQTTAEYAVVLSLITVAIVALVATLSGSIIAVFESVVGAVG